MAAWEVLLLVVWLGCAFGGYEIGKRKGLPSLILGLLVGMVGVIPLHAPSDTRGQGRGGVTIGLHLSPLEC